MKPFLTGLAGGWSLAYEPASGDPIFILRGVRRNAFDVARLPEGRRVFYEVKRQLDIADERMQYGAQREGQWKALDKAKLAMETTLRLIGRWSDGLLDNDVCGFDSEEVA